MSTFLEAVSAFWKAMHGNMELADEKLSDVIQHITGGIEDVIPGSRFENLNRNLKPKDVELFFLSLIERADSAIDTEKLTEAFVLIAAVDFVNFVDNLFMVILGKEQTRRIAIEVATVILNPLSGFIRFALNLPTVFAEETTDLQTPEGEALTRLREMIHIYATEIIESHSGGIDRKEGGAIYARSISSMFRKTVVSECTYVSELACGYENIKQLIIIDKVLGMDSCIIPVEKVPADPLVQEWVDFYEKLLRSPENREAHMKFEESAGIQNDELISVLKLMPLTCLSLGSLSEQQVRFIVNEILGQNKGRSAFMIVLAELMLFIDQEFASLLWKTTLDMIDQRVDLTAEQYYIALFVLVRFLDSLSYSWPDLVTAEDITRLEMIGMIGLCHSEGAVRKASLCVIQTVVRYESDLWYTLLNSRAALPTVFVKFFDQNPASSLETAVVRPERMFDIVSIATSNASHLWQMTLSGIVTLTMDEIKPEQILELKKRILKSVKNHAIDSGFQMNLLTVYACLLERTAEDLDDQMLKFVLANAKTLNSVDISAYITMLRSIPSACYSKLIELLEESFDMKTASFLCRVIAWSDYFSEHDINSFLEAFFRLTQVMTHKNLLRRDLNFALSEEDNENFRANLPVLIEYCASVYQLFKFFEETHMKEQNECFPCQMVVNDPDSPEIKLFANLFNSLLSFTLYKGSERLITYATMALSKYIICSPIMDSPALSSDAFLSQIDKISGFCPSILQNLLTHHFEILPKFLDMSLRPGGGKYLSAICNYFRPSKAPAEVDVKLILMEQQWKNLSPMTNDSEKMQIVYENSGKLIFCCLYYITKDALGLLHEAFILLATMIPLIYVFHMEGRTDQVGLLVDEFFQSCSQSLSSLNQEMIVKLSKVICDELVFCLEQFLKAVFTTFQHCDVEGVRELVPVVVPWLQAVEIDIENRVISSESTYAFIEFSGYSLVETILRSLEKVQPDDMASPVYLIWKALVIKDETPGPNFLPVLLCLNDIAPNYNDVLQRTIRFMFTLDPESVASVVVSSCKFTLSFFKCQRQEETDTKKLLFILRCLSVLMEDSMEYFLGYLPTLLAFSMAYLDVFPSEVIVFGRKIIKQLKPFMKEDIQVEYSCLCDVFSTVNDTLDHRTPAVIYDFFEELDSESGTEFAMELLRWGVCSGDIPRATAALRAKPMVTSTTIIGLCARALVNVAAAAAVSDKREQYMDYMVAMLTAVQSMTEELMMDETIPPECALMWIALDTLRCPDNRVFASAVHLLDTFFSKKKLFEVLSEEAEFDGTQFQTNVVWRFHSSWNDTYGGFADCICDRHTEEPYDVSKSIELLNHLVQTKYLALFIPSDAAVYTLILLLLPWIWQIIHSEMKAGLSLQAEVTMMRDTIDSFCALLVGEEDGDLRECLQRQNENGYSLDLHDDMIFIADSALYLGDPSELKLVCRFYTDLLRFGPKTMHSNIYYIVCRILSANAECSDHLHDFATIIQSDTNPLHARVIETFNEAYCPSEDYQEEEREFPTFPLFERIVAVTIPHLFEPNITDFEVGQFEDPNTFPPLLPNDSSILELEKFSSIAYQLKHIVVDPYEKWRIVINKLKVNLVEEGDRSASMVPKKCTHIKEIDIQSIMTDAVAPYAVHAAEGAAEPEPGPAPETEETAFEEEETAAIAEEFIEEEDIERASPSELEEKMMANPYAIFAFDASIFVPDEDYVNQIGEEIFAREEEDCE